MGQKLKFQKTCQNPFYKSFRVVLCKNPLEKTQIFEKLDHFENQPSCKGYSLSKILTLGQKLKNQNTCQNLFYKSFRVVVCEKRLEKTLYSRNETILKIGHYAKAICLGKILTLGQKLKFQKTCQNLFYKSFRVVLCAKGLKKSCKGYIRESSLCQNLFYKSFRVVVCEKRLEKTLYSRNETILKIGHYAKAICLGKILTLGQKFKFQKTCQNLFYKSFRVVLCKKPLEKTPNIREMRPF